MDADIDWLPAAVRNLRRAALTCIVLTVAMVGQCSAFGVQTASGPSYVAVAADPVDFLRILGTLVGPLLLVEVVLLALTFTRPSLRAVRSVRLAAILATVGAPLTAYLGFVLGISRLCNSVGRPTVAESASCAAATASMASVFGVIGAAIALGSAVALARRLSAAPSPNIQDV